MPNLPSTAAAIPAVTDSKLRPVNTNISLNELSTITSAIQRCILDELKISGTTIHNASVTIKLIKDAGAPTPVSATATCPLLITALIGFNICFTNPIFLTNSNICAV